MKKRNPHRILAVAATTRHIGYAVIEDGDLIYHGVCAMAPKEDSAETARAAGRIALKIIDHLHPARMVIARHFKEACPRMAPLIAVADALEDMARRQGLASQRVALASIRKQVCGDPRAGRFRFCRDLAYRFTELRIPYFRLRWSKEPFHGHLFYAAGAALLARREFPPKRVTT